MDVNELDRYREKLTVEAEDNTIVQVLMERHGLTQDDAVDEITAAYEDVLAGDDPETVLLECLGLEPDYIFDFLLL